MLSMLNKSMIRALSLDLDKVGYKPFLVCFGETTHHVQTVGHVFNALFDLLAGCGNEVVILYKKGVGDNVRLEFFFERDGLVHVDEISNSTHDFLADYHARGGVALS